MNPLAENLKEAKKIFEQNKGNVVVTCRNNETRMNRECKTLREAEEFYSE